MGANARRQRSTQGIEGARFLHYAGTQLSDRAREEINAGW